MMYDSLHGKLPQVARRNGGLSGSRRGLDVRKKHVEGNVIDHRRAEEIQLRAQADVER